jgi:hypothetical protein
MNSAPPLCSYLLLFFTYPQPEIALEEREAIQKMFEYAARQGWMQGNGG